MSEPIFSVLTGKAQSCDSNGNCYYCAALFQADRIYGTFTVTGAGSVTYTDPDDANNPWNGTFDLNGTYTYNNGLWSKDNKRLSLDFDSATARIQLDIWPSSENGGTTPPAPDGNCCNYIDAIWESNFNAAVDIQNSCGTRTIPSTEYALATPYYPGFTVTGSAPTVTWNPDNTNRTICNNAGGVYAGVWHSSYGGDGQYYFPTSTVEECLIYTLVPDADGAGSGGACATPSSPGGTYTFVSKNSYPGDTTDWSVCGVGTCCNGDCVTPFTDCVTTASNTGVAGPPGGCP